jgi:hypothetical protein
MARSVFKAQLAANLSRRTKKLKVVFAAIKLIETDIRLDGNTRSRVAEIGIAARHDGKAFAFWLPGKVGDGVCALLRRYLEDGTTDM